MYMSRDFSDIEDINEDDDINFNFDDLNDLEEIIEIDEKDIILSNDLIKGINSEDASDLVTDDNEEVILSKHKIEGKHSLKYDSIFKGKKDEGLNEDEGAIMDIFYRDSIEVDRGSSYWYESVDNEKYIRSKQVTERVYEVLLEKTSINFLNNRRKPSKVDFNIYFNILKLDTRTENFTNIELFNELAIYFSDNLFNMFKLLENDYRVLIMNELQEHVGKLSTSKEVSNRNIYEGTEVEFTWKEELGDVIYITGSVIEVDYTTSTYAINSYEKIYRIHLSDITKILNNTKFKYNMNKLNNIDFL